MDYFYRLPFDVYLLLVMSRLTGLPVYEAVIKAEKPIQVDPPLLAGLFTAMNTIFQEIGHKQVALESVAGPGLRFLIEWGNEVATLVMTDRDTYYLRQAVKQFTRDFEAQYASQIKSGTPNLDAYNGAEEIIKRNFPFFTIAGG
ncbi:MAG TPA: hypothetical protein VKK79_12695, partial [Candidatus Lokiarchaeia archaeon]|nr:hypothetical protein [Candidatus Lokiarchaeia archaeon]